MIAIPVTLVSADGTEYAAPVQEIRTPMRFFEYFKHLLSVDFPDPLKDNAARKLAMAIVEIAYSEPTLIYDKVKTEKQKVNVRNEIPPVIVQVHKEDSIIGKNDLLTANHLQKLNELQSRMRISFLAEIGYLVLSLLFVLLILKYLEAYQPGVAHNIRKTAVILLGVLLIFALARIAVHLSLFDQGNHKLSHVAYAVPLGALGVILTLLTRAHLRRRAEHHPPLRTVESGRYKKVPTGAPKGFNKAPQKAPKWQNSRYFVTKCGKLPPI